MITNMILMKMTARVKQNEMDNARQRRFKCVYIRRRKRMRQTRPICMFVLFTSWTIWTTEVFFYLCRSLVRFFASRDASRNRVDQYDWSELQETSVLLLSISNSLKANDDKFSKWKRAQDDSHSKFENLRSSRRGSYVEERNRDDDWFDGEIRNKLSNVLSKCWIRA